LKNLATHAHRYIQYLFTTEKRSRNIERMMEGYSAKEYHQIQHFISEANWSARLVMDDAALEVNKLFSGNKSVGLLIDESGEVKKGDDSVGVSHQYCGNVGKLANAQVGVFGCLVSENHSSLIDARLFLPESWADSPQRCDKAGIPEEYQVYKKKVMLALDIVKRQKENGIKFDWVGADGFYGADSDFTTGLDNLNVLFVADIHSTQTLYLEPFEIEIPQKKTNGKGKTPSIAKPNKESIKANEYIKTLQESDWQKVVLRNGTKGALVCKTHTKQVYRLENGICKPRILIIRKTKKAGIEEIKYALSNAKLGDYTAEELVIFQSERFFIEDSFKETRQNVGMFEYQVRGWKAWHHHIALVMQAMAFLLNEKIYFAEDLPLLSATDVREMMIDMQLNTSKKDLDLLERIKIRHQKRQKDKDRYYKNIAQVLET
jgi:SRSO17 transposase